MSSLVNHTKQRLMLKISIYILSFFLFSSLAFSQDKSTNTFYFDKEILHVSEGYEPNLFNKEELTHSPATVDDTLYFVFNPGVAFVFLVTNQNASYASSQAVYTNDSTAYILFESGLYDAFGSKNLDLNRFFFFQEQTSLQNNDTIFFLDNNAQNELEFIATDMDGTPLRTYQGIKTQQIKIFFPADVDMELIGFKIADERALFFTNVSERYRIFPAYVQRDITETKIFHIIQYDPFSGVNQSMTLDFDVNDYFEQTFRINFDPSSNLFRIGFLTGTKWINDEGKWDASFNGVISSVLNDPWEASFYYMEDKAVDTGTSFFFNIYNDDAYSYFQTKPFTIINDSLINDFDGSSPVLVRSANADLLHYGQGAVFTNFKFDNFISFNDNVIGKIGNPAIKGMFGEDRISETLQSHYNIKDTLGNILDFGLLGNFSNFLTDEEICIFEIENEKYIIGDEYGQAIMRAYIDFDKEDRNPPNFTSLKILDWKKIPRQEIRTNEPATLSFSVADGSSPMSLKGILLDSSHVMISLHQQNTWQTINYFKTAYDEEEGEILEADLSNWTTDEAIYDLKFVITDSSLNKTEYFLRPAFAIKDYLAGERDKITSEEPHFKIYPNPAKSYLSIELPETTETTEYRIFNLEGKIVSKGFLYKSTGFIDLHKLRSGTYLLKIQNNNFYICRKLIKQ